MNETSNASESEPVPARELRRVFVRDAIVFQTKLMLDGLRDLVLFPVALIAAAVDFARRDGPPGRHFYEVVQFGKGTERWIDLFEAVDRAPETSRSRLDPEGPKLDDFIDDIETKLKAGHDKGQLSAAAREIVEEMLEAARRKLDDSVARA